MHIWPNYTYLKKMRLDGQEEDRVVARPISFAIQELPDALILSESG